MDYTPPPHFIVYEYVMQNSNLDVKPAMNQEVLLDFSPLAQSIQPGSIYVHYKGPRYKILGVARHSETLEEMVVYQALYDQEDIWVRPLTLFAESVTINGELIQRFTKEEI